MEIITVNKPGHQLYVMHEGLTPKLGDLLVHDGMVITIQTQGELNAILATMSPVTILIPFIKPETILDHENI